MLRHTEKTIKADTIQIALCKFYFMTRLQTITINEILIQDAEDDVCHTQQTINNREKIRKRQTV